MTLSTLMMPAVFLLMLVFSNSVQPAQSLYLKFQYGGKWINAGDSNLEWIYYSLAYNNFDTTGGLYQYTSSAYTKNVCASGFLPPMSLPEGDISFLASGKGEYGTAPSAKLNGWEFRDLMIHTMWEGVQKVTNPTGWSIIVPEVTGDCVSNNQNCPTGTNKCAAQHWGHNVPSIMRVNVYEDDGRLRPEFFQVTLSEYQTGNSEGCSNVGKSFGIALGLIPEIGGIVSATVAIQCLFE